MATNPAHWQGYDYVVNRVSPSSGKAALEKNRGNEWSREKAAEGDIEGDIYGYPYERGRRANGTTS